MTGRKLRLEITVGNDGGKSGGNAGKNTVPLSFMQCKLQTGTKLDFIPVEKV